MLIYLAWPIDDTDGADNGRQEALDRLADCGCAVYDPHGAMHAPRQDAVGTVKVHAAALRVSDGVLGGLPEGVPSVGVPMEIQGGVDLNKPVVAYKPGSHSLQLEGMGVPVCTDIQAAIDCLLMKVEEERWPALRVNGGAILYEDITVDDLVSTQSLVSKIKWSIRWTGDPECEPRRHHVGDAGFDLICAERMVVQPHSFADANCGIRIEFPPGIWGRITGRSSTLRRRGLMVAEGIIDNGYRGDLFAGLWNLEDEVRVVERGDRIAQLILHDLVAHRVAFERATTPLMISDRGENAFGSTG